MVLQLQLILGFFLFTQTAVAGVWNRHILAMWDSNGEAEDYASTVIHRKLEFVFNHYGYILDFVDIHQGALPKNTEKYAGIVSWFNREGMKNPDAYSSWLSGEVKKGKKVLIFGTPGFVVDEKGKSESIERVNRVLGELGMDFTGKFSDNPLLISTASSRGKDFVEFERSLEHEVSSFRFVKNLSRKNEVWLSLKSKGDQENSDVVIVGDKGAYVQDGFAIFFHPQDGKSQWRVNPFRVVERVFGAKAWPVPDTTTKNGKRIYFSQIDGDGFINVSEVDRKLYSSEVILKEIIQKYKLPVTASVITAETNPSWGVVKDPRIKEIAKKLFNEPNVEPASHTFSHPLSWAKNPGKAEREAYLGKNSQAKGPIVSYRLTENLDYAKETTGSIEEINQTLTTKKASTLLWSGSCRPPAEALKLLEAKGYLNLNGGDSRMDSSYDSHGHLSPLGRREGGALQVYAGNANENIYTNLWSPPFAGYRDVIQTFERTESPRRLKPVDVYFHYYSGDHEASLQSLRIVHEWVKKRDLEAIFASEYARIVQGFFTATIEEKNPDEFVIKNNGALRTLRFRSDRVPDYKRSSNVKAHTLFQGELYVTLGDAPQTTLVLIPGEK